MRRSRTPPRLLAVVLSLLPLGLTGQEPSALDRFASRTDALHDELIEIRRDFHRHPEVSGSEERTSRVVSERLTELGFQVRTGVGGHGVVGRLDGASPGPVVAFRADMDAVRSNAEDPVEFRSLTPGVRHICGHDIHTTIGLAIAEGFAEIRDEFAGSIVLVFQPAEERATGARAMVEERALDDHDPAAIFAYHTAPLNVGQVATQPGVMMAWRDRLSVTIQGRGDLASVTKAARRAVLEIGTLEPGQAFGVAPDPEFIYPQLGAIAKSNGGLTFGATVTTASVKATEAAQRAIETRLAELSTEEVEIELQYEPQWIAGVTNDADLTKRASDSIRSVLGTGSVLPTGGVVPAFSEDFGTFQERIPGVMFFLGVSNPEKGWVGMPHSPGYVADEESIGIGAKAMAAVLLDFLASAAR